MEKEFGTFRKSTFGGFNRKDVINYIEKMKNETFEYKMQVEETIKNLNVKICELENAARLIEEEPSALPVGDGLSSEALSGESVGDIKEATRHLKSVADELCRSLGDFIEKLTQKGLCEGRSDSVQECENVFAAEETEADAVESILSALSFLDERSDAPEHSAFSVKEESKGSTDVEEILSVLSFLV